MEWNPNLTLKSYIPEKIQQYFRCEAKFLEEKLRLERLTFVLIPAPIPMHSGHKIRVVTMENPEWYRELFQEHGNFRRDLSQNALERIANDEDQEYRSGNYFFQDYICKKKRGKLKGIKYKERKLRINHRNHYDKVYRDLIFNRLVQGDENIMYFTEPVCEVRRLFGLEKAQEI